MKPEFRDYSALSLEELHETLAVLRYQDADYNGIVSAMFIRRFDFIDNWDGSAYFFNHTKRFF